MSKYLVRVYKDTMVEIGLAELPNLEELKIMRRLFGATKIVLVNNTNGKILNKV